jgi:hypothetical protein
MSVTDTRSCWLVLWSEFLAVSYSIVLAVSFISILHIIETGFYLLNLCIEYDVYSRLETFTIFDRSSGLRHWYNLDIYPIGKARPVSFLNWRYVTEHNLFLCRVWKLAFNQYIVTRNNTKVTLHGNVSVILPANRLFKRTLLTNLLLHYS